MRNRLMITCILVLLIGPACGVHLSENPSDILPSIWIQLDWNGEPISFELSSDDVLMNQLLDVYETDFSPERLLGGPGIRTLLEMNLIGEIIAIHTIADFNKQWVREPLPMSDHFFLHQSRTFALAMASPDVAWIDEESFQIKDSVEGVWKYGSVLVEVDFLLTDLRAEGSGNAILTQTATFITTGDIPSSFLLGFPGIPKGKKLSYTFIVPVIYQTTQPPASEGFKEALLIVAPSGVLPADIGLQGGSFARLLNSFGGFR